MNKCIIITGGSKGIGKAIAAKFAAEGNNIAIAARGAEALEATANELRKINPAIKIYTEAIDATNKVDIISFIQNVNQQFGQIDILVNNAGVFLPGNLQDEEEGTLENLMQTNLYSAYQITRAALPMIEKSKTPHIFNICSSASLQAYKHGGSYGISKFAMLGFSKNLRLELASKKIKVTAVMLGATFTDSWKETDLPMEKFMQASDVADMIYACSQLSATAVVEEIIMKPITGDID